MEIYMKNIDLKQYLHADGGFIDFEFIKKSFFCFIVVYTTRKEKTNS